MGIIFRAQVNFHRFMPGLFYHLKVKIMEFSEDQLKQLRELIKEENKILYKKLGDIRLHIGILESSIQNLTVYIVTKDGMGDLEKIDEINKRKRKGFFSFIKK